MVKRGVGVGEGTKNVTRQMSYVSRCPRRIGFGGRFRWGTKGARVYTYVGLGLGLAFHNYGPTYIDICTTTYTLSISGLCSGLKATCNL